MKMTLQAAQSAMEDLYAEQGQPVLAVALNDPLTPLDQEQIRAIEWVLIAGTDDLTLDSLTNGNIIFRRFLCTPPALPPLVDQILIYIQWPVISTRSKLSQKEFPAPT